ncbi:MAG: fibronectin type III domain-containing protein [Mogibacterium sp.]|nr:fibronectin type III domain-containing protein [Mogibacterium sp.]MBQ6501917.1 fibronectin type III domain-containing protein [Mogibacterium sp.]
MTTEKAYQNGPNKTEHYRIVTILATVLFFIFIFMPGSAYAEDYKDDSGITFHYTVSGTEDDRYIVITGCDKDTIPEDGTINVPEEIEGYPVTELGEKSLYSLMDMKKAVIPGSVQKIGYGAFSYSDNLEEAVLSEGLISIGANAFNGTGLRAVSFPESLESIGDEAFGNCSKLREVSISKGVSSISQNAFAYCLALEAFHTDSDNKSFTAIDGVLFSADGTTLIKYPAKRMEDGQQPSEYTVPAGTVTIGDGAFQYAGYDAAYGGTLKKVNMADSVENIGSSAFEYCNGLTEITLPSALKTIGSGAFSGCDHIATINIPKGLTYLPSDAFAGCNRIEAYNVEEGNASFSSDEGVLFSADGTVLMKYPSLKADKEYVVPQGVCTISDYAFQNVELAESIIVTDGVKTIGDWAFSQCYALNHITLPDSLESIGSYAFAFSSNLRNISLPDELKVIRDHAFHMMGLTEIEIPGTVEVIDEYTFATSMSLEKVVLNKGTKKIGLKAFENCIKLSELTIPDTVETIESDILDGTGAYLPDGREIKIIGYLGSAAEAFVNEKAEELNLVLERAVQPADQNISVQTSRSCIYGSKPFSLGASAMTPLTYTSSNEKVAVVSSKGVVTLKGVGTAVITINAREDNYYKEASAKVTISVSPGKPALKAKNIRKRKVKIVWSKVEGADGYEIYIKAPGKKTFKKRATKSARVKSITHSGLRKGKKYSYKVRAFTTVDGKKVYGAFSAVKRVKIKR